MSKVTEAAAQVEASVAEIKADLALLAQQAAALNARIAALQAQLDALAPPLPAFMPPIPTPLDIYTDQPTLHLDLNSAAAWVGKAFNIISTGAVQTQIQVDNLDWWKEQPDAAGGGKVWADVHATGTNPTLWQCADGLAAFNQAPSGGDTGTGTDTPPPVSGPTGEADLSSTPTVPAATPITADPNIHVMRLGASGVYYNGRMIPPLPANGDRSLAVNLGAYSFTGLDGKTVYDLPAHWCRAAFVDESADPLDVIFTPAQLAENNLCFTYGDTGIPVQQQGATPPYTPMGSSSITKYMPTTGERPDIGLITDNEAFFLLGGAPDAMFAWTRGGNSFPDKYVDDATWMPVDLLKYPQANHYYTIGGQGAPDMADGPGSEGGSAGPGGLTPQKAHFPSLWYTTFLATRKAWVLWQGQNSATFMWVDDAYNSGQPNPPKAVPCGEQRGIGWQLREAFMIHRATLLFEQGGGKTGPGTFLQPSSYWQTLLDQARAFLDSYRTDPANQTFRLFGADMTAPAGPWQQDYVLSALSFGMLTGHREWEAIYLFALGNAIDRTSGTSGWPPCYAGYYLNYKLPTWSAVLQDLTVNGNGAGTLTQALVDSMIANPMNGGVCLGTPEYMMTTRAVLAMAITLDNKNLASVRGAYPQLDTCYANAHKLAASIGYINPRQSVMAMAA